MHYEAGLDSKGLVVKIFSREDSDGIAWHTGYTVERPGWELEITSSAGEHKG